MNNLCETLLFIVYINLNNRPTVNITLLVSIYSLIYF